MFGYRLSNWGLAIFERMLAISLLQEDVPPMSREEEGGKAHLGNRVTWSSLLYLAQIPGTTIFFVIAVTVITTSVSMLIAPLLYQVVFVKRK